ncbi:MAG: hypothetical protein AB7E76_02855 [Deferribacterales bacterium]
MPENEKKRLVFEDGIVTLDSEPLPGILVSASVGSEVIWDDAKEDGMSGKKRVAMGWDDASVNIVVDLLTEDDSDCYDKLRVLDKTFKGHDNKGLPQVYAVRNRHTLARGINNVAFDRLESAEDDQTDIIRCTLRFTEHIPAVVKMESETAANSAAPQDTTQKTDPKLDETITANVK